MNSMYWRWNIWIWSSIRQWIELHDCVKLYSLLIVRTYHRADVLFTFERNDMYLSHIVALIIEQHEKEYISKMKERIMNNIIENLVIRSSKPIQKYALDTFYNSFKVLAKIILTSQHIGTEFCFWLFCNIFPLD